MRRLGEVEHRDEIDQRIERERMLEEGFDDEVPARADHQGVAVCGRFHDEFDGDVARCAGLVLHHDLPAQLLREPLGGDAPEDIGEPARGSVDDHPDRAVGIGALCRRERGEKTEKDSGGEIERSHFAPESRSRIVAEISLISIFLPLLATWVIAWARSMISAFFTVPLSTTTPSRVVTSIPTPAMLAVSSRISTLEPGGASSRSASAT